MRLKYILLFVIMSGFAGMAWTQTVQSKQYRLMLRSLLSNSVPTLSVHEVNTRYHEYKLLDAREPKECAVSMIQGAQPVGYDHFDPSSVDGIDKTTPILVYCSVGYRSEKIAEKLIKMGYTQVFNLYGGIFEWVNQGNPVVTPQGQATERVHAYSRTWGVWLRKGEKVY